MKEIKNEYKDVEACIYESDVAYKMYFWINKDEDASFGLTEELKSPMVNIDYDENGYIIGVEILGGKTK